MLDKMGPQTRVNTLTILTGLVVGYVRHGLETKWEPWRGIEHFFGSWFVHYFALLFLVVGAGTAISAWHKFFLGGKREFTQDVLKYQYYIATTVLVASVAIYILAILPPGTFGSDD